MDKKSQNHIIAKAVRIEYDPKSDTINLVFEVLDERFKQKIKQDWMQDIDVKIVGRNLVEDE